VLRNKSLVIVSILVLVLAVVAMACAPATPPAKPPAPPVTTPVAPPVTPPVTPPAVTPVTPTPVAPPAIVEKVTSYKSVKYTDPTYKFSVAYPDGWTAAPATLTGGVFYAKGTGKDLVYIAVRPATEFKSTANTFLADLIKLSGAAFAPSIDNESTITLADGTKANVILLSAAFGMAKASITGVLKDGNAIMIMAGTDPKNMDLYKEIGSTLITK
jgi:hypothetical protein